MKSVGGFPGCLLQIGPLGKYQPSGSQPTTSPF